MQNNKKNSEYSELKNNGKCMNKLFITFCLIIFFSSICRADENNMPHVSIADAIHQLKNHTLQMDSPLQKRFLKTPDLILKYLKTIDEIDNYSDYKLSEDEKQIIVDIIKLLPDNLKKILMDNLIGIYFVNNFISNGYTEWVIDEKKNIYCFMVFNPDVLKRNISDILTKRENTCFINDDTNISLTVEVSGNYSGFLYILLHESAHIADYLNRYTPYVEDILMEIQGFKKEDKKFTDKIWNDYSIPFKKFDFPYRKDLTFYGFGNGPKIKLSDAVKVYEQFSNSTFFSLYASKNWAEDFAEYVSFYYLTNILNTQYSIIVKKKGREIYNIKPVGMKHIFQREKIVKKLFNAE